MAAIFGFAHAAAVPSAAGTGAEDGRRSRPRRPLGAATSELEARPPAPELNIAGARYAVKSTCDGYAVVANPLVAAPLGITLLSGTPWRARLCSCPLRPGFTSLTRS